MLASDFYVNIFGAFTENPTQETSTIAPQRIVERVSFKTKSLLEIMAPRRKRSSVRSDNVQENTATSPPPSQAAPTVGVTQEELDAVVLGLNQQLSAQNAQLEAQNALILSKLNDLLRANRQPGNNDGNPTVGVQDLEGNISQRAADPIERTPPQAGGL